MAQRIKLRRSSVAGRIPTTSSLSLGEIAVNTADGKFFFQRSDETIQSFFTTNALITGSLQQSGSDSYFLSNVGIGTTTPSYTLDVSGNGRFTAGLKVTGSLDVSGSINHDGDLTVTGTVTAQEFKTEFVSASIIYQSGSTKFGDTSDDTHLFTGSLEVTSGDTSVSKITINGERNSYLKIQDSGSRFSLLQRRSDLTEGQLRILQNGSTKFIFTDGGHLGINTATVPSRALEVEGEIRSTSGSYLATAGGNVGIGTSLPTRKLHVEGSSYLKLANNSFLDFSTPVNTRWWITDNSATFTMYLQASRTGTYRLRTGDNAKSTYFIQNRSGSCL